jgi:hypothetical protein
MRGKRARHGDRGDQLAAARDVHAYDRRPRLRPVRGHLGPTADAIGWPCWRSCIAYPAVLLASAAFRAATKPSVLKESVTPAGLARGVNRRVPSSSPRELITPRVFGGCMTWVAAPAGSTATALDRVAISAVSFIGFPPSAGVRLAQTTFGWCDPGHTHAEVFGPSTALNRHHAQANAVGVAAMPR